VTRKRSLNLEPISSLFSSPLIVMITRYIARVYHNKISPRKYTLFSSKSIKREKKSPVRVCVFFCVFVVYFVCVCVFFCVCALPYVVDKKKRM